MRLCSSREADGDLLACSAICSWRQPSSTVRSRPTSVVGVAIRIFCSSA